MRARRTAPLLIALLVAAGACGPTGTPDPTPSPPAVRWSELPLPVENATVRDLARCGDQWLAVGALRTAAVAGGLPGYQPAAWLGEPSGSWRPLAIKPESFYGERAILRSVACRDGEIVAVGGASGGVHGNSRVTTWRGSVAEQTLKENPPPEAELFGGNSAVGVGQIAAGPGNTYAIAGNWLDSQGRPGPAIWRSTDGRSWQRLPDDPTRSSTEQTAIRATDMYADTDGYLLVGEQRTAESTTPYVLRSSDGQRWARVAVPHSGGLLAAGEVLVGALGSDVLVWRAEDGQWAGAGGFLVDDGPMPVGSGGTGRYGSYTAVAACGGTSCGVWTAADGSTTWTRLTGPHLPSATPSSTFGLVTDGARMLLFTDTGTKTQIFLGEPAG